MSAAGSAWVLHPEFRSEAAAPDGAARGPERRLEEAVALTRAVAPEIGAAEILPIRRARPATLFGSGQLAAVAERLDDAARRPDVIVVNAALTAVQHRNLERTLKVKALDRTALILEIFGARARTREGRLQVELAALSYQRSRLVRSWTHLERQRGGLGFVGGPGESQLEVDRRRIDERIVRLKRGLEAVRRTRGMHRAARRRVPYPVVVLVGYTNAGKSTLFNRLTGADAVAEDRLFATLDPAMRALALESGRVAILSDTVGFVSDLPTELIAAFRATLEEVIEADLILHVRDAAHPDSRAQNADVQKTLADLGAAALAEGRVVEVCNKIDALAPETRAALERRTARENAGVAVSALEGAGLGALRRCIDRRLAGGRAIGEFALRAADGAALAWLYRRGQVLDRADDGESIHVRVALDPADLARFGTRFPAVRGDASRDRRPPAGVSSP